MDKELIAGLSNLSESLDRISEALSKKGEPKSASATALQMGEFDKQVREISNSITEVKKDTQKLLDQQDTILKILKKKEKDSKVESKKEKVKDIPQESTPVKVGRDKKSERDENDGGKSKKISTGKTSTEEVSKEKKNEKKPGFFGDMDTKKIKDGISSVLLIAVGIIAIGMALKLVGKVDFVSVMALALALPLIAFAFGKIAAVFSGQTVEDAKGRKVKTEKLNVKDIPSVILAMVGFSTAILVSSYILSKVKPVGLFQAVTSILIAGTFAVIAPSLGKMMRGFSGLSLMTMAKSIIFLPLVLLGVATAIMLSSYVLSKVKPIGLFQAMTAILIAGTFAVISYGLGKLLGAFKGINPIVALAAAVLMPILLLAISTAIMLSSYVLSKVKPIGLFQALSAIFIAATFAVISYGIGKIISAFKGINPITALMAAEIMPGLFFSLSFSIMLSSYVLSKVKPIGLFQALTSILIAATFAVISYGIGKIISAFKGLDPATAIAAAIIMPILFVALSISIMISSFFLSKVRPIGLFQFLTGIGIAIMFVAFAYAMKFIVKAIKDIKKGDVISSFINLTIMTLAVAVAGFIISKMPDISLVKTLKAIVFTGGLLAISYLFKSIIKATDGMSSTSLVKTAIKLALIIGSIVAAGYLVNKMPSINLVRVVQFTALSIALAFVTIIMAGVVKVLDRIGLSSIIKGGIAIVALAGVIMVSSILLSKGRYNKYPNYKWSLSVALSLGIFGVAAFLLGTQATNPMFYAGMGIIVALSGVIVIASFVLSKGKYDKYPTPSWSLGVGMSLAAFGLGAVLLGTQVFNPFFYAGLGMILVVAASVVATSYILDAGKYDKYPSFGWVGPTVLVLGSFGLVAVGLGIVSPLLLLGLPAMLGVAGTIYLVDKMFSNGNYNKYPTKDWVNPTISLIGKFSGMAILYAFGLPLIILGSLAILAIAGTIYLVDKVFKNGEFKKFPSDKWVSGVAKTMQSVSKLLQDIRKNLGFGDLVLGAIKLLGTVYVIKKMDDVFSKGLFQKFPSKKWNDGVKYTIQTFMQLMKDKGFLTVIKERLGSALGGGLDDIAKIIVKIDSVLSKGQFNKFPSSDWSKNVISSLRLFKSLMGESSIAGSIGQGIKSLFSGGEKSTASLPGIAQQITSVSLILSKGVYDKFPSSVWGSSIQSLFIKFTSLMSMTSKSALGAPALIMVSNSIVAVDKILSSGAYNKYPNDKWINSVFGVLGKFSKLVSEFGKSVATTLFGVSSVINVSKALLTIDQIIGKGKYTKYPSEKWIKGISLTLGEFRKILSEYGKSFLSLTIGSKVVSGISESIVKLDEVFSRGKFTKFPNDKWTKGTIYSLNEFKKLISGTASSIISLTIGSKSINSIVNSILSIDKLLSSGKYSKYPDKKWLDGTFSAIRDYSNLTSSIKLVDTILSDFKINKIVNSILSIENKLSSGKYNKFPDSKWIKGVGNSITEFSKLFDIKIGLISMISGSIKLNTIVNSILSIEKKLSAGNYTKYPDTKWVKGITSSIDEFGKLFGTKLGIFEVLSGSFKLNLIVDKILDIDKKLSAGSYTKYPDSKWIKGVSNSISEFSKLFSLKLNISNILLGSFNLNRVVNSIVDINKKLSVGNYTKYPDTKWVKGITSSINEFSKLFSLKLNISSILLGSFNLNRVVNSIVDINKKLSAGSYTKYPDTKWVKGITSSINEFSKLFSLKLSLSNILSGSFNLNRVVNSIVDINKKLSVGNYTKYPDSKWVKGISNSINEFGKLFSIKLSLSDILLGNLKVNRLVDLILQLDKKLSIGKYVKYPDSKWIKPVINTITEFGNLVIGSNKKYPTTQLFMGIIKVNSIVDFILKIDKKLESGKYQKTPNSKWLKDSINSILEYGKMIVLSDKSFKWTNLLSGIFKVRSIVENILWVDRKLSSGKYQKYPDQNWITKTSNSILQYGRLAIGANKEFPIVNLLLGIFKINLIVNTLVSVDKKISSGNYKKFPDQNWINKTSSSIMQFGKLAIDSNLRFGIVGLMLGMYKVRKIADTIQYVSIALSKGNYTKFPNLQWALAVPAAIRGFMSFNFGLFSGILSLFKSDKSEKNELGKIVDLMLFVDKKFQSGNWQKFPSVQWVNGTILALQKFRSIVSLLSYSSFGDRLLSAFGAKNPIVTAVSNIEKLGVSFDKLAKSIRAFTESIKGIDGDKLAAIRSLSSNVVMMSLMDPAQFDMMMSKLEERSGVFGDLIKDFEVKKTKGASGGGTGVSYNTKSPTKTDNKKSDSQILGEKLDLMNALLADISSVVGSRGALKTYLNKIKDDVTIGGGLNTLTQRSDRRLKNIIKRTGVSDSGINIYLFTYTFDPTTVYQGVIAQELIGTKYQDALHTDKNGLYSVDYSLLDVDFKKTNV